MKTRKVRNKFSKKIYEFVCFSSEHRHYFYYRPVPLETKFEVGHILDWQPIGLTWEELRHEEKS